jgi:hypothetical protein
MKLIVRVKCSEIDGFENLKENEYAFLVTYSEGKNCSIVYKCPGCNKAVIITDKDSGHNNAHWEIDFETLTAKPSIVHDKNKGGCGWHGYLTDGELAGTIE